MPRNSYFHKVKKALSNNVQILGLSESNLDVLAKFMGHDIRIHRQFYRLPENTVDLAKVTKIMHLINTGNMSKYKGKDFDDIEFSQTGNNFYSYLHVESLLL